MKTTQTWTVMLIAAGPATLACAALGVIEYSTGHTLLIDLVGAYPAALMAFLPGIPVLAWTLKRAFPCATAGKVTSRVRPAWLVASWFAPWWHVAALELLLQSPLFEWQLVAKHSAVMWFVTAAGWICLSTRPRVRKPDAVPMKDDVLQPVVATKKSERSKYNEPEDTSWMSAGAPFQIPEVRPTFCLQEKPIEETTWNQAAWRVNG